jgi:tetratricopeptide (TPR) repeat protein
MKSFIALVTSLLLSATLFAADEWKATYEKGVAAAANRQWDDAISTMQKTIAANSKEDADAHIGAAALPYIPYYWLGIALLNDGDTAGAIDALRSSVAQGEVQKTSYYASLQNALNIAQAQKGRSQKEVRDTKKADEAISRAMMRQIEASAAGAAGDDSYRVASEKLRIAFESRKTGTPPAVLQATQAATEAAALFTTATQAAKERRQKAAVVPTPVTTTAAVKEPVTTPNTNPQPPVVTPSKRPVIENRPPPVVPTPTEETPTTKPPEPVTQPPVAQPATFPQPLASAYRELLNGRFDRAEELTDYYLRSNARSADGFMLRGCTRYIRGVLKNDKEQIALAADDFRAALRIRPSSTIDGRLFSPKLVAFFEDIRNGR